jgi:ectoine hydroxylase-related dioxygenase (phytanoyl-CoA dioxygenase family)
MNASSPGHECPPPRQRLDDALADVDRHGVGVLEGGLSPAETSAVRDRLWAVAGKKEASGQRDFVPADADRLNIRLLNLIDSDPWFIGLSALPMVLAAVRHSIGERFILSNYSANIQGPGAGSMSLHADQGYVMEPWPDVPLAVNIGWMIDDFTDDVGATRFVPGSHKAVESPDPQREYESIPIEGPAGSMLIMDGRVWHTSGINRTTDRYRAAIFGYYVLPWIRQQLNWREVLSPATVAQCTPEYLDLLGYASGNRELFNPGARAYRQARKQGAKAPTI